MQPAGAIVGVARFIRIDARRSGRRARDHRRRRLAGLAASAPRLIQALAARAREEGIVRFEAPVLATNAEAIRVLEALGDTTNSARAARCS